MTAATFAQALKGPSRVRAGSVAVRTYKGGTDSALRAYLQGMVQLAATGQAPQGLKQATDYLASCGASGALGDLLDATVRMGRTAQRMGTVRKYRADQSRDDRGRFADEGKGRGRGGGSTSMSVPADTSLPSKLGTVAQALAEVKQGAPAEGVASKLKAAARSFGEGFRDLMLVPGMMETVAGAAIITGLLVYFWMGGPIPAPKDLPDFINPGRELLWWLWKNLPKV